MNYKKKTFFTHDEIIFCVSYCLQWGHPIYEFAFALNFREKLYYFRFQKAKLLCQMKLKAWTGPTDYTTDKMI